MTKLTDTQFVVLSAAANRLDGSILPLPANIKGGAAIKVMDALIRRGLAERIESDLSAGSDLVRVTVRITRAGFEAIGVEPEDDQTHASDSAQAETEPPAKGKRCREGTKQALLIEMLRRKEGATIDQIAKATGWRRHTVRGAIAGAIKKRLGLTVESERVEGRGRVYRITDAG